MTRTAIRKKAHTIYPPGVEIRPNWHVSWGIIQAVGGQLVKLDHSNLLTGTEITYRSTPPWGGYEQWLIVPAGVFSKLVAVTPEGWRPREDWSWGHVGSLSAIVWYHQFNGTKLRWTAVDAVQVSIKVSDYTRAEAISAIFDKLWKYRKDSKCVTVRVTSYDEEEGLSYHHFEDYYLPHEASETAALRQARLDFPDSQIAINQEIEASRSQDWEDEF